MSFIVVAPNDEQAKRMNDLAIDIGKEKVTLGSEAELLRNKMKRRDPNVDDPVQ